jgi:hypothetical protein
MSQDGLLFVAQDLEFIVGLETTTLLGETDDWAYVDDMKGNVRVPRDKWDRAQRYERNTWMTVCCDA